MKSEIWMVCRKFCTVFTEWADCYVMTVPFMLCKMDGKIQSQLFLRKEGEICLGSSHIQSGSVERINMPWKVSPWKGTSLQHQPGLNLNVLDYERKLHHLSCLSFKKIPWNFFPKCMSQYSTLHCTKKSAFHTSKPNSGTGQWSIEKSSDNVWNSTWTEKLHSEK